MWRFPSTPTGTVTTYVMTDDQFDGTFEQADYVDLASDVSPGCNVLGGGAEDWSTELERPLVWELSELDEPFERGELLPQGNNFSHDVDVQGAWWDIPYGVARATPTATAC